ncbi:hypothetical protein ANO11243_096350 [Dothideomycetidae sp. 11243]|nr:hypothetical protein ANO11243_096350 [fungal sp. No.11243]
MPPKRAEQQPPPPRRSQPFRPPGPAKRSTSSASAVPISVPDSDQDEDEDEEDEFGTALDLDAVDIAALTQQPPAPQRQKPTPFSRAARSPIEQEAQEEEEQQENQQKSLGETDTPALPAALLTRIMASQFKHEDTGVSRGANEMLARYVRVFVLEAVARSAAAKRDGDEKDGDGEGRGEADMWLEAADLEGVAPGLVLDFC